LSKRSIRILTALVLYAVAAVPINCMWLSNPGIEGYDRAAYLEMVHGTAHRPYVMRALVPAVIRTISNALKPVIEPEIGPKFAETLTSFAKKNSKPLYDVVKRWKWSPGFYTEYLVGMIVCYLFLIGFAFALRWLVLEIYDTSHWVVLFLPFFALAALPMMFRYFSYVYDFANLMFFTLGLIMLARRNMTAFYAVYIIGLFNKETMVLLALVYWLQMRKDDDKTARRLHLAGMAVAFIVIRMIISAAFADNPGVKFEVHFFKHNILYLWTEQYEYFRIVAFSLLGLGIFYKWKEKPLFLRHALAVVVPLLFLTFWMGFLDEFRDYYEAYSAGFLLIADSFCRVLDIPLTPKN